MFVIGLTGGIGAGKTQVSRILEELGAAVINADLVGHEAYLPNTETWREVVDAFGSDIVDEDGQIIRSKLGAIVFGDPAELERLNAIVHPRIYAMIADRIADLTENGAEVVVVEAALLIEAGWTPLTDEVWVVTSSAEQVTERLTARGLSSQQAQARIASQMPQDERVTHADEVIANDGSISELEDLIRKQWESRVAARVQGDQRDT